VSDGGENQEARRMGIITPDRKTKGQPFII